MKKTISWLLVLLMLVTALPLTGCGAGYTPIPGLDTDTPVTMTIAIPTQTDRALTLLANEFMLEYPNVTVLLEYVDNYEQNAEQLLRNGEVDMILHRDVVYSETTLEDEETGQTTSYTSEDFYYDFGADTEINFSDTNPLIMGNFTHTRTDASGAKVTYQYAVPLGGEVRGIFVNTTFLDSLGLSVPTNYTELLSCCEAIQQAGYVPIQGNPSTTAVAFGLGSATLPVVSDEEKLELMRTAGEGVSELFRPTMEQLYELACLRYYDYKYIEETEEMFLVTADVAQAQSFLGISVDETTYETKLPENNFGTVAFFPYISSTKRVIEDLITENNLDTQFEFILTPLNDAGQDAAAYFTMYYGLCADKNGDNLIWAREFVNYTFCEKNNEAYAENADIIPNVRDATTLLAKKYDVPEENCVLCGEIYFSSDYNGYSPLAKSFINVMKCSAEKYMVQLETDEAGQIRYRIDNDGREYLLLCDGKQDTEEETRIYRENIGQEDSQRPGYAFCTLDYYMDKAEKIFEGYRNP